MNEFDIESLKELLETKQYRRLRETLLEMNEADIAEFISELDPKTGLLVFRMMPKELSAEVFSYLDSEVYNDIIKSMSQSELISITEELALDDAVDFIGELPANMVNKILGSITSERRNEINLFLRYPENSAGSVMTNEFVRLRKSMNVKEAIDHIRKTGTGKETVYSLYVTDDQRKLEGVLSLRELLVSDNSTLIGDIMETNLVDCHTDEDVEVIADRIRHYDLTALPVTDNEGRLVGIVTIDDAVDIITDEATEDFEKMAAMLPSEKTYLRSSVFELAKHRIIWLVVLMLSASISGNILVKYSDFYAHFPILISFTPMLMGTGGNAGSQSSTTIIRGMSLGEIEKSDYILTVLKETAVSLVVGLILCLANFARIAIFYPGQMSLAITVSIALLVTVVVAKFTGTALPMLAKSLKLDPALMAAPIVTTIVDAASLSCYFTIAIKLMSM